MKILVIRNEPPWPLHFGGKLHAYHLCRRLAERHELLLVAQRACEGGDAPFNFEVRTSPLFEREIDPESGCPRPNRLEKYFGIDMAFARDVGKLARQWRPDVAIGMNYHSLAYLARIDNAPTICDLLDDEVLHRWRELWHGRATSKWNDLKCLLAVYLFERKYAARLDAMTVLSEADRRACRFVTRHPRVECIPHGVDCEHYAPSKGVIDEGRVIFWGGLTFGPNISAILFFAEKVWPLVCERRPEFRWSILGRGHSPLLDKVRSKPGIEWVGYVDDIRPHVQRAAVVVVPMVSGSGIKNKIMEAWAMGKAVLCTRRALGDLPGEHGRNVWLADSPKKLADGLLELMQNPQLRAELGRAGRETAVARCSWDHAANRLEDLCAELANGNEAVRFDVDLSQGREEKRALSAEAVSSDR